MHAALVALMTTLFSLELEKSVVGWLPRLVLHWTSGLSFIVLIHI
jgi:hypothetical protein